MTLSKTNFSMGKELTHTYVWASKVPTTFSTIPQSEFPGNTAAASVIITIPLVPHALRHEPAERIPYRVTLLSAGLCCFLHPHPPEKGYIEALTLGASECNLTGNKILMETTKFKGGH